MKGKLDQNIKLSAEMYEGYLKAPTACVMQLLFHPQYSFSHVKHRLHIVCASCNFSRNIAVHTRKFDQVESPVKLRRHFPVNSPLVIHTI